METEKPVLPQKSTSHFPSVVFLLFIILVLAISALWYEVQQIRHDSLTTQKHLIAFTASQTATTDNVTHQITAQQNTLTALNGQVSQLMNRVSNDQHAFKVSEIVYLVKMANLRLSTQHDITSALILLKQANQELNALSDPALEPFREAVMKNISTLQAITPVDVENISAQLTQLQAQVPSLSILVEPKPDTSILENTPHEAQKKWWNRAWDNIKASLKELVIVRHQSADIPAMMTPDQQTYLAQNVQLLLVQTQWALLNHNSAVYESSLNQATTWVSKYYVQNSATTQAFLKSLNTLKAININPPVPDLSLSLSLISQGTH